MRYRLIACDLDETLLSTDRTVCQRNRQAIAAAQRQGVLFVCATGRGFNSVYGTQKEIGQYGLAGRYTISFNGGAITENAGDRVLHFDGLDFEQAAQLYRRGLDFDVCVHVYTMHDVYVRNMTPLEKGYLAGRMSVTEINDDDIKFLKDVPVAKVLYMNPSYDYLHTVEQSLADLTGGMDVSYSSNRYLEFNRKGVNKGAGLLRLAALLGIDPAATIAIGDNINDLPMLKAAGLGVAVANAVTDIKPLCGYVTQATNDQGAVGEVIERFILNQR